MNLTSHSIVYATEDQLNKLESAVHRFLDENPHVIIDENHPEVAHMRDHFKTTSHHDYIKESLGNYLENTVEVTGQTDESDFDVMKGLFTDFYQSMPEIKSDHKMELMNKIFSGEV